MKSSKVDPMDHRLGSSSSGFDSISEVTDIASSRNRHSSIEIERVSNNERELNHTPRAVGKALRLLGIQSEALHRVKALRVMGVIEDDYQFSKEGIFLTQ